MEGWGVGRDPHNPKNEEQVWDPPFWRKESFSSHRITSIVGLTKRWSHITPKNCQNQVLYLLPSGLNWSSLWLKLCHHKVMAVLSFRMKMCSLYNLHIYAFVWSHMPQTKSLCGSNGAAPHLEPILQNTEEFCSYHTFPGPNKAWIFTSPH